MTEAPGARPKRRFDPEFEWRGRDVSRLEGLTDAVFAIVLALLFLRSEPPSNFEDLSTAMKSLLPFAAMFAIIAYVWFELWLFSRRYALRDGWTLVLNLLLLFLLLFYAYPLKFLFTLLAVLLFGPIGELTRESMSVGGTGARVAEMFVIYGAGYGSIFGVLGLLYWRALALAQRLGLSPVERYLTRAGLRKCAVQVAVAALSIAVALAGVIEFGAPGWAYMLIGPALTVHGIRVDRAVSRLRAALPQPADDGRPTAH